MDGADLDGVDTGSWGALGQDLMAKRVAYGSRLKAKRVPYGSRLKAKRVPYCRSAKWYPFSLQEGFSHDPHIGLRRPKGYHIALAQGQKGTIWWIYHMVPFWPSALQYGTLLAPPHIYIYTNVNPRISILVSGDPGSRQAELSGAGTVFSNSFFE